MIVQIALLLLGIEALRYSGFAGFVISKPLPCQNYLTEAAVRSAMWWWWAGAWPGSRPPGLSSPGISRSGETV